MNVLEEGDEIISISEGDGGNVLIGGKSGTTCEVKLGDASNPNFDVTVSIPAPSDAPVVKVYPTISLASTLI